MKSTTVKNKKGFSMIELVIVMAIVGVILAAVVPALIASANKGNITSTIATVKSLQTAGVGYFAANGGTFASTGSVGAINLANMISTNANVLPGNSQGNGAWGGTILIAPDANANWFDVTIPNIPSKAIADQLTAAVANFAQAAPVYTAASNTWEVTL